MTALPAFFFDKEMYGRFAGPKKSGSNNEVTVLPRWLEGGVPLYPVRSVKLSSCLKLLTNISVLLVSNRLGQPGSCGIAQKGIQKALAAETTSLG